MLINKSIVEKWYQTDSWVYKNFAYLFQNPIWHKKVPNGFSVCPYFWMNLFSLFVFRPFFVFPMQYFLLPIMKVIGSPAVVVDKFIFTKVKKVLNGSGVYFPGFGLITGVAFTFLTGSFIFLLCVIVAKLYLFYKFITLTSPGTFVFWSIASFLVLLGVIALHKSFTKTPCKTMYYLFVWLALFIPACAVVVPTETLTLIVLIATQIGHFFGNCGGALWFSAKFLAFWIWIGIKILMSWKPIPVLLLPWWGYLAILALVGWIVSKCTVYVEERHINTMRKENPAELYARFRKTWIASFVRILNICETWKKNVYFENEYEYYTAKACGCYRQSIFETAFELMWKNELDKLQVNYPNLKEGTWDTMVDMCGDTNSRFTTYGKGLIPATDFPEYSALKFMVSIKSVVESDSVLANDIKILAAKHKAEDQAKEKRAEAIYDSWSRRTCIKVTEKIAVTVHNVGRGLKTIAVQTATFAAYGWMLIKAKKQGACPYFRFETPKTLKDK